jgi:hypothetical protein
MPGLPPLLLPLPACAAQLLLLSAGSAADGSSGVKLRLLAGRLGFRRSQRYAAASWLLLLVLPTPHTTLP